MSKISEITIIAPPIMIYISRFFMKIFMKKILNLIFFHIIVTQKPNTRDTSIISLYKDTVHFIVQENNIRETLPDEMNSHCKQVNVEEMKKIEQDFENESNKFF